MCLTRVWGNESMHKGWCARPSSTFTAVRLYLMHSPLPPPSCNGTLRTHPTPGFGWQDDVSIGLRRPTGIGADVQPQTEMASTRVSDEASVHPVRPACVCPAPRQLRHLRAACGYACKVCERTRPCELDISGHPRCVRSCTRKHRITKCYRLNKRQLGGFFFPRFRSAERLLLD